MSIPKNTTLTLSVVELTDSSSFPDDNYDTAFGYEVGGSGGDTGSGTNTLTSSTSVTFGSNDTISFIDANGNSHSFTYSNILTSSSNNGVMIVHESWHADLVGTGNYI